MYINKFSYTCSWSGEERWIKNNTKSKEGRTDGKRKGGREESKGGGREGRKGGREEGGKEGEKEGAERGGRQGESEGRKEEREKASEQFRRFQSLPHFRPICCKCEHELHSQMFKFPLLSLYVPLTVRTSPWAKCDSCV